MSVEKQKTILLVEDEVLTAMSERMIIEEFGYKVITANSGEEAVAAVEKMPAINLILMDINLGDGIDGTEAAALILSKRDLPVVFLSSHTEPEVVAKTEKITSYGYVVKNSSITVLDASIKMAFKLFAAKKKEMEKENALKESEARAQAMLRAIPDLVFRLDRRGVFLDYKADISDLFAQSDPTIIGKRNRDLVPTEFADLIDLQIRSTLETGTLQTFEYQLTISGRGMRDYEARMVASGADEVTTIVRDISERKQVDAQRQTALEALRVSEERYRDLVENSHDLICTHDLEGKLLSVNKAAAMLTGYSIKSLLDMNMADLIDPEVRRFFKAYLLKVRAAGRARGLMRIRTASGEIRYWEYDNTLRTKGVTVPVVRGMAHDITERELAEDKLRKNEERYRALVENASDFVYRTDKAGHFTFMNQAALKATGYAENELMGQQYVTLVRPDMRAKALKLYGLQFVKGIHNTYSELPILAKDGREIWIGQNIQLIMKDGEVKGFQAVSRDITERKQTEFQREAALAALEASEKRFKLSMEATSDGLWDWNVKTDESYFSPNYYRMLGYEVGAFPAAGSSWKYLIHSDDREHALTMNMDCIDGRREFFEVEYRLKARNGEWRWILARGKCIARDEQGRALRLVGTHVDITERKRAEEVLRESEDRYRTLIKNVGEGICFVNPEEQFVFANAAAENIFGVTPGGLLRRSLLEFVKSEQFGMIREQTDRRLSGEKNVYEIEICRPQGEKRNLLITAVPQFDSQGKFLGTFGVFRDITERKQAEEEVKRQLLEKELLLKEVHHRIKNNIASIGGLISLHLKSITNPEAVAVLQAAIGRVKSMGILYDKLLLSEDYKDISVKNYLNDLIDTIIAIFPDKAKISIDKQIADFHFDSKRLFLLGIIINELLTNKMKYAFINSDNGLIKISLENIADHITLTIQDNGNELPDGFDIDEAKGFGLMIVKMLCRQMRGSFAMEKKAGTRCTVEFDI
jgi:PAS domain S-box-containing protein